MIETLHCRFCRAEMDLAQRFTYLVEAQTVGDPVMMAAIRRLPHLNGVPLRCCKGCQAGIERARAAAPGRPAPAGRPRGHGLLFATAVAVGLGMVTAKFGNWLAGGPAPQV